MVSGQGRRQVDSYATPRRGALALLRSESYVFHISSQMSDSAAKTSLLFVSCEKHGRTQTRVDDASNA